jgi:hypothetical protein
VNSFSNRLDLVPTELDTMANHQNTLLRTPSASVLAVLPERAAAFLRGVVLFPSARAALEVGGYTEAEHREGVRLLAAFFEYPVSPASSSIDDDPARAEAAEIGEWVRRHFTRLRRGVERVHGPGNAIFAGIEAPNAEDEVVALANLLDRLNALAPEQAAVGATLAQRGLNARERERLAGLVARARTLGRVGADPREHDGREAQLIALYHWHSDWTGTARVMIRNKNVLAALGIARKKWRSSQASTDVDDSAEA